MSSSANSIPWKNIVSFHTEVVKRSEDAFFSMSRGKEPSDRWAFLMDFELDSVHGDWKVPYSKVDSPVFLRKIRNNEISELYFGGPSWISWSKKYNSSRFTAEFRPFFFREVSIGRLDEDYFTLEAVQDIWDLSPLVISLLERASIIPSFSLEEMADNVFLSDYFDTELKQRNSKKIIRTILSLLPDFEKHFNYDLRDDNTGIKVFPWMLFTPSQGGAISRNLMKDYKALSRSVEIQKEIGGLSLIDNPVFSNDVEEVEVLPIVPLNEGQYESVSRILETKPITVVSGPPGCGKSQVVVSILLNAWLKGKSVLFASNNNQAVDVVRDRLKHFEKDFPVAIRAGSKKNSNLEEALGQIQSYLSSAKKGNISKSDQLEKRRSGLLTKKEKLNTFIDTKIPEQIEQGVRACLNAYSIYSNTRKKREERDFYFNSKLEFLGLDSSASSFFKDDFIELDKWYEVGKDYIESWNRDEGQKKTLNDEIEKNIAIRAKNLTKLGMNIDSIGDLSWLLNTEIHEKMLNWYSSYKDFILDINDVDLHSPEWDKDYDYWSGSTDVSSWKDSAKSLSHKIKSIIAEAAPILERLENLDSKKNAALSELIKIGLSESWHEDVTTLSEWSFCYSNYCTWEKGKLDWLPWSEYKKNLSIMKKHEVLLKKVYPLQIWRDIGSLNEDGREKLSIVIEKSLNYLKAFANWKDAESDRVKLEGTFKELRVDSTSVFNSDIPTQVSVEKWKEYLICLSDKEIISGKALGSWEKKEKEIYLKDQIKEYTDKYKNLGSGLILKSEWENSTGSDFLNILLDFESNPEGSYLEKIRQLFFSNIFSDFLSSWRKLKESIESDRNLNDKIDEFPGYEVYLDKWRKEWTLNYSNINDWLKNLPGKESLFAGHMKILAVLDDEWKIYSSKEEPAFLEQEKKEYSWAIDNLKEIISLIPLKESRTDVKNRLIKIFEQIGSPWPLDFIRTTFQRFSIKRIRDKIYRIDSELEVLSFQTAKAEWHHRNAENPEIHQALQELLIHYKRNRGSIDESIFPVFSKVLTAIPIWITTAQSPQAIPMAAQMFDIVVIDEATQCTLTNLLPLIYRGKRLAVIGDPEQLKPIPNITVEAEKNLGKRFALEKYLDKYGHSENDVYHTAVSCLPKRAGDVITLKEHYRSHPLIIGFSNQFIYHKNLKLKKNPENSELKIPYSGIYGKNVQGVSKRGRGGSSWINLDEAEAACQLVSEIREELAGSNVTIGVVTPFREQVHSIKEMLDSKNISKGVVVGTAHTYQGDEQDIMIFSPVVSKGMPDATIRWVQKPKNLINVAVTRAREALFIVSDFNICRRQNGILGNLIHFTEGVDHLRSIGVAHLNLFSWMVLQGWAPEINRQINEYTAPFVIEEDGSKLVIEISLDIEKADDKSDSKEALLAAHGYDLVVLSERVVIETPALALKRIAEKLEIVGDFDEDDFIL
ncbi:MAG: AAA domain-containing protein [Spirochaetia bacterium]|jgi:superfamily I DNA and/or RNA helicase|nr:AAA domain-containing protein [Spirochaetia bacterium]